MKHRKVSKYYETDCGFTYTACGPLTKNKERTEKFMQTGNTEYIYKKDLDKACFQFQ